MERLHVNSTNGYKIYPSGHFISYNLTTREIKELALALDGEGIITITLDRERAHINGITWPKGYFIHYKLNSYLGLVYYSTSERNIFSYKAGAKHLKKVEGVSLHLDYFGTYDPANPGNMGYNWRQIIWNLEEGAAYGVHGNSGYLFHFDPKDSKIDILDRVTSEPSKRSGMFDYFSYGYLGFQLDPDEKTLYYLTGGPIYVGDQ